MKDRGRANKTIDIRLQEERYYFPGELIKGMVVLNPKSPVKTNNIRLKFTGDVTLSVKEKESVNLFSEVKTIAVANDHAKTHVLEARQYEFPFEFQVPKHLSLPSAMEFGKRKARIRYTLSALHVRPMVPETLCAKAAYNIVILERVDVTDPEYKKEVTKTADISLPNTKYNQTCRATAEIPRTGYTRGDVVPLTVTITHFEKFSQKSAIKIDLVRTAEIRTSKETTTKDHELRSIKQDVNITGPFNFSHETSCQLLIPTNTPPTIRFKDRVLRIHYKVRVCVQLGKRKDDTTTIELPFIVGTWPPPAIPIDDDDDEDGINLKMGDIMLSDDDDDDDEDDDDTAADSTTGPPNYRRVSDPVRKRHVVKSTHSAATLSMTSSRNVSAVDRSSSSASRSSVHSVHSVSSYCSNHSWDNAGMPPRDQVVGQSLPINRSSSIPDIGEVQPASIQSSAVPSYTRPGTDQHVPGWMPRSGYNDGAPMDYRLSGPAFYRPGEAPMAGPSPAAPYHAHAYTPPHYGHTRMRSTDMGHAAFHQVPPAQPYSPAAPSYNIPTHVLQPIQPSTGVHNSQWNHPSASTSLPRLDQTPTYQRTYNGAIADLSDDSDDDNDLFSYIEKKKRNEMGRT